MPTTKINKELHTAPTQHHNKSAQQTMVIVISIALAFVAFFLLRQQFASASRKSLPPGSLGLPIIGDTLNFLNALKSNSPWALFEKKRAQYGPVFKMSLLASTVVVLPAPAGNKFLFSNEEKLVINSWPPGFRRLLGPHSLTAKTGDDFKRLKKVFMTFLKPEALQRYVPRVSRLTLENMSTKWDGKSEVSAFLAIKNFIFSIACSLFMSLDSEEGQLKLEEPFIYWAKGLIQVPLNIPGTMFHKALQKRELIRQILDELIRERKEELRQGSVSEVSDILSVMVSSQECSVDEIKDNLLLLLFAGHDTTTATLTVAVKFLCDHPFWKDRVVEENLAISLDKDQEYVLQWNDLKKMKVTWSVLQETLRLQPPAPGAYRDVVKDFEFAEFTIPKGWKVFWNVASHRRSEFFQEPDKFDPSRFEGEGPAPYTYVPFGGGPRMCPGNELARMIMLVFMHHFVRKYDWELVDPTEEITMDPMPMPKKGLHIKLSQR